jgi:cytochrome c-type biogenesis protein CcmH/NrfG
MAVVFAGGFVFFGVGSGNGGSGLGDLWNNIFNGGSGGPSISKAQKAVDKAPDSAAAWRQLATAYEAAGPEHAQDAIDALDTYTGFRPKDAAALGELAGLERTQAENLYNQAAEAQLRWQEANTASLFLPPSTSKLGQALGTDPIDQALQTQASSDLNDAISREQAAYTSVLDTYKKVVKLQPNVALNQVQLAQAAAAAGNTKLAVSAYTKAEKLDPTLKAQIDQAIKQLQSSGSG